MSSLDAGAPIPPETANASGPGSLGRRIIDTFVSPGELFSRFHGTPPWADVLLVSIVIGTVAMVLVPKDVWMAMAQDSISRMPAQQRQAMSPETIVNISRVTGPLGYAIGSLVMTFVIAGLLKLVFGVILKSEATFAQYRAIAAHAGLISALGVLVTLPVWIATGDMKTQLSAALLFSELPKGVVGSLVNAIAVFNLWWLFVVALGVSTVDRRISIVKSAGIIFAAFFVIAALGGLLTPGAAG